MEKVLIAGPYTEAALEKMKKDLEKDFEVVLIKKQEEFDEVLDADYIVLRTLKLPGDLISKMPNLKFIQRWGAGVDNIDIELAGKRGIPVANIAGANANAVAELTLLLMLAVYRNVLPINKSLRDGVWIKNSIDKISYTIDEKKVGIIGMGNIGKLVARYVTAMNAQVLYYDIDGRIHDEEEVSSYQAVSLDELLRESDIVTLHIPLNESTHYMIGKDQIEKMKQNAILINAARGGVVNEADLLNALKENKLLGAGLDCFEAEPIELNHPLLQLSNVVGSCHVGGNTADLAFKLAKLCPSNIRDFINGKLNERYVVNSKFLQ